MSKVGLLELLHRADIVTADGVSAELGVERPAASMALLRLSRQGLARRWIDPDDSCLRYELSERGLQRLNYLLGAEPQGAGRRRHHERGGTDMRRAKNHSGNFYCPECCVEYDLVNETSLKCPSCGGPLAEGTLEDMWDDKEE
jgi:transcription initiation factor IIE alpha subunit